MNKFFALIMLCSFLSLSCFSDGGESGDTVTYAVTYNGNGNTGGSVPVDSTNYEAGAAVTVPGNTGNLIRINDAGVSYRFAGWNTAANGSGTAYAQGETFPMGSVDIILYAQWVAYALRDTGPAGGLIFYDKGSYSGSPSWRYLEAAPSDSDLSLTPSSVWGTVHTALTGADGTAIGTGYQNTIDIVTYDPLSVTAADIFSNLVLGGYSDWFLPSRDELNQMYVNLKLYGVGGFAVDGDGYWSSSEMDTDFAWYQDFSTGGQHDGWKDYQPHLRAVRAF